MENPVLEPTKLLSSACSVEEKGFEHMLEYPGAIPARFQCKIQLQMEINEQNKNQWTSIKNYERHWISIGNL